MRTTVTLEDDSQHVVARDWMERSMVDPGGVGFAWAALLGFLRLATHAGILDRPLSMADGLRVVDTWLLHPAARVLMPTEHHAGILARLLHGAGEHSRHVGDAHLATLAIEYDAEFATFDRDFSRYPGLKCRVLR